MHGFMAFQDLGGIAAGATVSGVGEATGDPVTKYGGAILATMSEVFLKQNIDRAIDYCGQI